MNSKLAHTITFTASVTLICAAFIKVFGAKLPYLEDPCHGAVAALLFMAFIGYTRTTQKAYQGYFLQIAFALTAGYVTKNTCIRESEWMNILRPSTVAIVCFTACLVLNYVIDLYLYRGGRISVSMFRIRLTCCGLMLIASTFAFVLVSKQDEQSLTQALTLSNESEEKQSEVEPAETPPLPSYPGLEDVEEAVREGARLLLGDKPDENTAPLEPVNSAFDVTTAHDISSSVLNRLLKGVLKGKGDLFIREGRRNNISPAFLAAVSMHESANGTSSMAKDKNNVMGVYGKNSYRSFDTVDDCVAYMSKQLASRTYIGRGKKTIASIQRIYAPIGADNDPKKLNGEWTRGVVHYLNRIIDESINADSIASSK